MTSCADVAPDAKFYVAVRGDLAPGLQLAQALHVIDAFREAHPAVYAAWKARSNRIVVVATPDPLGLAALDAKACARGVPAVRFEDADLPAAQRWTALALAPVPAATKITRGLPLALARV